MHPSRKMHDDPIMRYFGSVAASSHTGTYPKMFEVSNDSSSRYAKASIISKAALLNHA